MCFQIAICTSDDRRATEDTLNNLELHHYVSALTCGDDVNLRPKPHPNHIQHVCDVMTLAPSDVIMVGDTRHDMRMGVDAGVALNIGVLSGTGSRLDLSRDADVIVANVKQALPVILEPLPEVNKRRKRTEDANGDADSVSAVIFDKDGTLVCFHSMWTPFAEKIIAQCVTSLPD